MEESFVPLVEEEERTEDDVVIEGVPLEGENDDEKKGVDENDLEEPQSNEEDSRTPTPNSMEIESGRVHAMRPQKRRGWTISIISALVLIGIVVLVFYATGGSKHYRRGANPEPVWKSIILCATRGGDPFMVGETSCLARGCCYDERHKLCLPPVSPKPPPAHCFAVHAAERIPCGSPFENYTNYACSDMGCCFENDSCWHPASLGYNLIDLDVGGFSCSFSPSQVSPHGIFGNLSAAPSPVSPLFSQGSQNVLMHVRLEGDSHFRLVLGDPRDMHWRRDADTTIHDGTAHGAVNPMYHIDYQFAPFGFTVHRRQFSPGGRSRHHAAVDRGEAIISLKQDFSAQMGGMAFSPQFSSVQFLLAPEVALYGLGQHIAPMSLEPADSDLPVQVYTIFSRDQGTPVHSGRGGDNVYGQHPFLLGVSQDTGDAFGVLLLNSHPMDVLIRKKPHVVTFRAGGALDFFFFLGPKPVDVIGQYLAIVGKPFLPPLWSLGFNLCRWGWKTLSEFKNVRAQMKAANFPLDVLWNDIDYMDSYRDFTVSSDRYEGAAALNAFVSELHGDGMRYVPIFDVGISNQKPYDPAYLSGVEKNVFIRNASGEGLELGLVWPGPTVFPDFFAANTSAWWREHLTAFHDEVAFDGGWFDMNEPANFCSGDCFDKNNTERRHIVPGGSYTLNVTGSPDGSNPVPSMPPPLMPKCPLKFGGDLMDYRDPPYVPGLAGSGKQLDAWTIDFASLQAGGRRHYEIHSLYGYSEIKATAPILEEITGKRPFIVTRSTYPGSQRYGTSWLGDNKSQWGHLKLSIATILTHGFLGQPFTGPDVCGFASDTSEELCTRWMELGAFYPFSRNHNAFDAVSQEPYVFSSGAQDRMRNAMVERYKLLPFLYTMVALSHMKGYPIARPLFMEFPAELKELKDLDTQFMLGDALLISPVLTKGATTVSAHVPTSSRWYWYFGGAFGQELPAESSARRTLSAPAIPVLLKGGKAVFTFSSAGLTVKDTVASPMILTAGLDGNGRASGSLYWDDGESIDPVARGNYSWVDVEVSANTTTGSIAVSAALSGYDPASLTLAAVRVCGMEARPSGTVSLVVGGVSQDVDDANVKFDPVTRLVSVEGLAVKPLEGFLLSWGG